MAEAVVVAIAGEIIAKPLPQALEKIGKLWGVKHEIEALRDIVSTLEAVLKYAEKQYYQDDQIHVWLNNMKDALYDAQDVLEEFNLEAMQRELRGHNEVIKEHLSKLVDLDICGCKELDLSKDENGNIISDLHGGLQNLRSLKIYHLPKLESLPQWLLQARNLEHLRILGCSNLRALPEQIEALQSLQWLNIEGCGLLMSLPEGMRGLASLTHLDIGGCKELDLSKDERGNILDFHGGFQSLRSVGIDGLESLPPWLLQLSNLECLSIFHSDNLKALPEQIEALQSLQELQIFNCPSLTSLPEGIRRLTSLNSLRSSTAQN
ncbi:hypothetical protein BT93_B0853 [Corymbia citriodora subsp. variegata]|nr:hypothetical protein BT93_B0853 [Corymbia citriodora subsp. variegata]